MPDEKLARAIRSRILGFVHFEDQPPEKFYFLKIREMRELFKVYDKIVKKLKQG